MTGDGALATADGKPVVDVSGLRIEVRKDEAGRVERLRLRETRKVAFREMIVPGDAYVATFTATG